jgi:hypothetical protein
MTELITGADAEKQATENPLTALALAQMHVQVPRRMTVRLTDTNRLALTDIGALFFTLFLSLAIGFGTTYFSHDHPSGALKAEFLGWVLFSVLTLLVILYFRYKMYTEPTETVTYKLDPNPTVSPPSNTGFGQGSPEKASIEEKADLPP